jgi:hypothetical protein
MKREEGIHDRDNKPEARQIFPHHRQILPVHSSSPFRSALMAVALGRRDWRPAEDLGESASSRSRAALGRPAMDPAQYGVQQPHQECQEETATTIGETVFCDVAIADERVLGRHPRPSDGDGCLESSRAGRRVRARWWRVGQEGSE